MSAWSVEVAALAKASNASWHALVEPLALMTRLTYTATSGSYYRPADRHATVEGWERPDGLTEDPPAGMRALFFVERATRRGVIAFRGTDLNMSSPSGRCDRCADLLLWSGSPASKLPPYCSPFSNATLDYYAAALDFVKRVREAYPTVDLLFTGHSLGAGLALAIATVTPPKPEARDTFSPAVAFAAPPWLPVLRRRAPHVPLPAESAARTRLYALADEWDPVQRASVQAAGLRGTQCLWRSPEPPACAQCFATTPVNSSSIACTRCFELRHVYAHYINTDVPGPRALCKPIGEAERARA